MKKGTISVLSSIGGAIAGAVAIGKVLGGRVIDNQKKSDKHLNLFLMMNQWVKVKQAGKNLSSWFEREGYQEIAIYGMHYAGETLVEELRDSNVKVKYGIDKNAGRIYADFDTVTPDTPLDKVDVIVVTPIAFFDEIEQMLSEKVDCPIISLEDIICQV